MTSKKISRSHFSCRKDSVRLGGTVYQPPGNSLPVAIVCHGFMANQRSADHYSRFLAGLGYPAFCFDFCGGSILYFQKRRQYR